MVLKQVARLRRPLAVIAAGAVLSAAALFGSQIGLGAQAPDAAYTAHYEAAAQQAVAQQTATGGQTLIKYKYPDYSAPVSPGPGIQAFSITWD